MFKKEIQKNKEEKIDRNDDDDSSVSSNKSKTRRGSPFVTVGVRIINDSISTETEKIKANQELKKHFENGNQKTAVFYIIKILSYDNNDEDEHLPYVVFRQTTYGTNESVGGVFINNFNQLNFSPGKYLIYFDSLLEDNKLLASNEPRKIVIEGTSFIQYIEVESDSSNQSTLNNPFDFIDTKKIDCIELDNGTCDFELQNQILQFFRNRKSLFENSVKGGGKQKTRSSTLLPTSPTSITSPISPISPISPTSSKTSKLLMTQVINNKSYEEILKSYFINNDNAYKNPETRIMIDSILNNQLYLYSYKFSRYNDMIHDNDFIIQDNYKQLSRLRPFVHSKIIDDVLRKDPTSRVEVELQKDDRIRDSIDDYFGPIKIKQKNVSLKTLAAEKFVETMKKQEQAKTDPDTFYKNEVNRIKHLYFNVISSLKGDARIKIRNDLCELIIRLAFAGNTFESNFLNYSLLGSAGVGKTKVGLALGKVLKEMGVLLSGNFLEKSPKDLIGQYIGQTSVKVNALITDSLENILFIDEAYGIIQSCKDGKIDKTGSQYGLEAITELVNAMDKKIGLFVVVTAGYEKDMHECFFSANEGLYRRFPYIWKLPNYSPDDLFHIFLSNLQKELSPQLLSEMNVMKHMKKYIHKLSGEAKLPNQAGDILNLTTAYISVFLDYRIKNFELDKISDITITFINDHYDEAFNAYVDQTLPQKDLKWSVQS